VPFAVSPIPIRKLNAPACERARERRGGGAGRAGGPVLDRSVSYPRCSLTLIFGRL
jgi:hypothetical protein